MAEVEDRQEFAARMRRQLRARYRGADVEVDDRAFALRVRSAGIESSLPLSALHQACRSHPGRTGSLIADWVRQAERQLSPRTGVEVRPARLLWCVRSESYLSSLSRADELVTRPLGAGMVAFIAEELPGSLMRGLPREDLVGAGLDEAAAGERADANTAARFTSLPARIRSADRIPADGWRLGSDPLFQGSVVTIPGVLSAFVERAGGEVLLAVPDRSMVLALPAHLPAAARFRMRVVREWREAMNPVSRELLITDGRSLREVPRHVRHSGPTLLGWLRA
jgi:hypothetical protein